MLNYLGGLNMIEYLVGSYIGIIAKIIERIDIRFGASGISISIREEAEHNLDERIAKLDSARQNLVDGITAIDELKTEAEHNKREVSKALEQVTSLQ